MKKVVNLIFVLIIVLGVAGCGNNKQTSNSTKTTNVQNPKIYIEKLDAEMKKNPPKIAGPYIQRGRYRMQYNDIKGAVEDFKTALQYEPNNKAAQSMLQNAERRLNKQNY